ncbi:hypothetical protein EV175_000399 [Coemansia sp. RSA 1933]|nr:hypothetical protein EV175_000399 [Coemansia sp. RSA 1933]
MTMKLLRRKNQRRGKNDDGKVFKGELIFKEEGQEYGQVTQVLGNGVLDVSCSDGVNRRAQIRGRMKRKTRFAVGDIILVSLREYEDNKSDVIHRYEANEARLLKQYGELGGNVDPDKGDEHASDLDGDSDVEFEIDDI